jgi:hypothetical protein
MWLENSGNNGCEEGEFVMGSLRDRVINAESSKMLENS